MMSVVLPREIEASASGAPPPLVSAVDLSLAYDTPDGAVTALSGVDLDIDRGEFVSFIGPSGCGKTTFLRVVAGLIEPSHGTVLLNGKPPQEARRERLYGYVLQTPALFPWRTVLRNVMLPLEVMKARREDRLDLALGALDTVGLSDFKRKFPWQLSGGMQQRVAIARALSFSPSVLLMDEPFGALDEITRDNLNLHLTRLWAAKDLTVLFVTHSIQEAVFLSSRIVVMSARPGRVVEIIESRLPRERDLDIRDQPEFHRLMARVRSALRRNHTYE